MRQRRVDLERLAGRLQLLLLAERRDRAHVVQAVGQLDQHHPQVLGHGDDHLAVVLDLGLLAAREADPGQLGDPVHQQRHLVAEAHAHVVELGVGVLDHVVQECGGDRGRVELQLGADVGDRQRVVDERLAALAHLPGVVVAGIVERGAGSGPRRRRGCTPRRGRAARPTDGRAVRPRRFEARLPCPYCSSGPPRRPARAAWDSKEPQRSQPAPSPRGRWATH